MNSCDCIGTILAVDDNPFNLLMLEGMLAGVGIKIDKAENGKEGLDMFIDDFQKQCCSIRYKLILMDLEMPILDGYQATEKIIEF